MNESWTSKSCLSHQWGTLEQNLTDTAHCPSVWDGFSCWGPTEAGRTVSARCPSFKGSDITKSAFRVCSHSGEWLNRDGIPSSVGWTNYTPCLTPEIREIMRRLGSNDDAQMKFKIAANTRILEFVGLSLSLAALLLSLLIFYYFRTLRNSRTRLHRHLFIAMVIQVAIRLTVYADQAIIRNMESDSNGTNPSRRGIDNTPILCEASYISLEYARTAMFMWMFVEGLFLHNMITVTVFEEKLSPLVYPVIGWIIPIPLTVTWALVTHLHYGSATCWWGYNFTLYFWILEGPRLAVLMVNLAFLLNILRVLVMKLRQSNSSETQQALKAVKAALVLLPLLGLTNLLNMVNAPLEKSPIQFALWSYTTHLLTSTQGFVLAFLYCFRNGEVQNAIRKFVRIRILRNSKRIILTTKPIPLSTLDNASMSHPDVGQASQTINVIQNPRTKFTTRGDQIHHHSTNSFLLQKETMNTPPLHNHTRSYSNGVLKQTAVEMDAHSYRTNQSDHHNTENPYSDSRRPLLNSTHNDPLISSPLNMTMPLTSSSTSALPGRCCTNNGERISKNHFFTNKFPEQNSTEKPPRSTTRHVKKTQMPNWRLLIIPDLLLRYSLGTGNQPDGDVSSGKQKGSRIETGIMRSDDEEEYAVKDESASQEVDQEEASSDFVSIEINQDSRSSYPDSDEDGNCRGCGGGCASRILFPVDNNELEYNDGELFDKNEKESIKAG